LFGDRIVVIHAKDFVIQDGTFKIVCAGQGRLNYELLLGMVKKRKPYISVLLEEAGADTVDDCVRFLNRAAA
jgi:L-ribulose-5-phosphate 3-epimerase UlaE